MAKERRIKLTDDQYERLREDRCSTDLLSVVLGKAMVAAADECVKRDCAFWATVRKMAGIDETDRVRLDWVMREVIVQTESEE